MNKQQRIISLTSNGFIAGLTLLLMNDFWLKYQYPNFVTGKISDVAGLFIFPIFVWVVTNRIKFAYCFTAVIFIFWKLKYSQFFLESISSLINLKISRTIDVTDLFALIILPFSYRYLKQAKISANQTNYISSRFLFFIAIFSFCATTLPREDFDVKLAIKKTYKLKMSKEEIIKSLKPRFGYSDTLPRNLQDTTFYFYFKIPEYTADATAVGTLKSIDANTTIMRLDSITNYRIGGTLFLGVKQSDIDGCKGLTPKLLTSYFENNFLAIILNKKISEHGIFFDNKELIDQHIKQ